MFLQVLFFVVVCSLVSISSDYAFPYIILVLSLVTLAVYMSASEIQVIAHSVLKNPKTKQKCTSKSQTHFFQQLFDSLNLRLTGSLSGSDIQIFLIARFCFISFVIEII